LEGTWSDLSGRRNRLKEDRSSVLVTLTVLDVWILRKRYEGNTRSFFDECPKCFELALE
jgi:hypothetical protein